MIEDVFVPRFGVRFGDVRLHTDARARRSAQMLNAKAYTVGSHIVLRAANPQPDSHLLAHELTHVLQQRAGAGEAAASTPLVNGMADGPRLQRAFADTLDYVQIAGRIYRAIAGLGTDEEAVYQALQQLQRDEEAIRRLKRIYLQNYEETLIEAIEGDFSGTEKEFAFQLLNYEARDSQAAERIEAQPGTESDWERQARRLYEAMPGTWGTEEEVVFAVLLPLNREPAQAVESMFEDADEWKLDCAQFVQVLHLYALLHTLGPFEFDRRFAGGPFELRMAEECLPSPNGQTAAQE